MPLEQAGKGRKTVKTNSEADIHNGRLLLQEEFGFVDSHLRQIFVRGSAIYLLEETEEMILRKTSLIGKLLQFDLLIKMRIDEAFGFDNAPIHIHFGMDLGAHGGK